MLRNVKDLRGYAILATDGVIGKVDDFYFDDEDWGIRYLVVDTGSWLSGRKVLISPIAVGHAGWMAQAASGSPDEGASGTQSRHRHQEAGLTAARSRVLRILRISVYWGGAGLWGMGAYPGGLTTEGRIEEELKAHGTHATSTPDDCHLRSSNAVIGHHIKATDGDIGHLEDLLVDDHTWAIRYLIVEHEQLVGRSPRARRAGLDQGRELVRGQGLCRSDSAGRQ